VEKIMEMTDFSAPSSVLYPESRANYLVCFGGSMIIYFQKIGFPVNNEPAE
jgi:hypothetical protein